MFTKELIDKTINHFKIEYGQLISEEIASEYLNSFADLYASYMELAAFEQGLKEKEKSRMIEEQKR